MAEFTGERVVPGEVEPDLWNEHVARYAFASRLASGRRVLDAGCGTGYGAAQLARTAAAVIGVDSSAEAANYARTHYRAANLEFLQASCEALPVAAGSIGLVTAFEVIEHLSGWREFLTEIRRVLAAAGELVISTPNTRYYAESRKLTGPNPFHVHEFEYADFAGELARLFPHVTVFLQNHVDGIAFQPSACDRELELERTGSSGQPSEAHFFVAVCGPAPSPAPGLLFLPGTGNVLRERELHIEMLERELATKDQWLDQLRREKQDLVEMFREQKEQLDRSNAWAADLDDRLRAAQARIAGLQEELALTTEGYQARVAELEAESEKRAEWARRVQAELDQKGRELLEVIRLLDQAEKTVEERTAWATRAESEGDALRGKLAMVRASRWLKLGRVIRLGPALEED